jgi:hypothetical protein
VVNVHLNFAGNPTPLALTTPVVSSAVYRVFGERFDDGAKTAALVALR